MDSPAILPRSPPHSAPHASQSHPDVDSDFRVGEVLLSFVAEGVVVEEHPGAVAAEEAVRHYIDGIAPDVA